PIDGSLNAKRGLPFFSLSLAVAEGPVMGDVVFGFVHDFGTGEEWTAVRGGGARLNGALLEGQGPDEEIELLVCEATRTQRVAHAAGGLVGVARRLRLMGSLALSLCHLAAGRVDAVCSLKPARSVDIAAGQLLVRERGLAAELVDGGPLAEAPLDLEGRPRIVPGAAPAARRRDGRGRVARRARPGRGGDRRVTRNGRARPCSRPLRYARRVATHDDVMGALAGVIDPELKRPVTELGMVRAIEIDSGRVAV